MEAKLGSWGFEVVEEGRGRETGDILRSWEGGMSWIGLRSRYLTPGKVSYGDIPLSTRRWGVCAEHLHLPQQGSNGVTNAHVVQERVESLT